MFLLFLLFYCTLFLSLFAFYFFSLNDASIYRLQWQLLLHLSTMVAILWQWLVKPFFYNIQLPPTIHHYMAEFSCHIWKLHGPHMKSFLADIWSIDRYLKQESKKIEFASMGLLQLQIFNFEWPKVNIGRMWDLTLKAVIFTLFLFFFLALNFQKGICNIPHSGIKITLSCQLKTE